MSRFVDKAATVEIALRNGDVVQVRPRLTASEVAELNRRLVRLRFDVAAEKVVVDEGDWHLQRIAMLRAHLVDWDLKDDAGQGVPCTGANIELLDDESVAEIWGAISKLRASGEEEERKNGSGL